VLKALGLRLLVAVGAHCLAGEWGAHLHRGSARTRTFKGSMEDQAMEIVEHSA
jgi:hypothetical protein